jgi:hypothetical protein
VQFTDEPAVTCIVWLFSFVLGFSRPIWARFVLHQEMQTVLRCHSSSWRVNAKSPVAFRQPSAGGYPGVRKSFTCAAVGWPQASQRGPLVRFFTANGKHSVVPFPHPALETHSRSGDKRIVQIH